MYLPIALTDCYGVDTSGRLTSARLAVLKGVDLHDFWPTIPKGTPITFIFRCVPLPGNAVGQDINIEELQEIDEQQFVLLLYQHVRAGSWTASGSQGAADGQHAAQYATSIGYQPAKGYPAPNLCQDLESVRNPGPDAYAQAQGYRDIVQQGWGFRGLAYEGFDCGLTDAQLAQLGTPLWSDYGPRKSPPGRGFACKQYEQKTIDGMAFDGNHATPDLTGECLVGMGSVQVEATTEDSFAKPAQSGRTMAARLTAGPPRAEAVPAADAGPRGRATSRGQPGPRRAPT